MNETANEFWTNTINAQAYSGISGLDFSKYFLSLFIVIILMLILAWLAYKTGWLKIPANKSSESDQVIFYSQFTTDQTLLIVEQEKAIHCYISKGKQIILATTLPGLEVKAASRLYPPGGKSALPKKTFQETWMNIIQRRKGNS